MGEPDAPDERLPDGGESATSEGELRGDDVEQRIYRAIRETREPRTANAVADQVDCDPKTARKYLGWFSDLGIVTHHDGRTATYERNDAYFEWRRINQLATAHTVDTLQDRMRELTARITAYEATYDATAPADVDAVAAADASDRSLDDVHADLDDWANALDDRARHERARQQRARSRPDPASG